MTCAGGGEDLADRSRDLSQQQQQPVEKVIGCWDDQIYHKKTKDKDSGDGASADDEIYHDNTAVSSPSQVEC